MMIADSDVLIDFLRGKGGGAERIRLELETGRLATTVLSVFELLGGARGKREEQRVETLLEALTILPLDPAAARRAAEVRRELERAGRKIATADSLIAGICMNYRGVLLTRNRSHFERIDGLHLGTITEG